MNRVGDLSQPRKPMPDLFEGPTERQSEPTGLSYRRVSPPLSVPLDDAA